MKVRRILQFPHLYKINQEYDSEGPKGYDSNLMNVSKALNNRKERISKNFTETETEMAFFSSKPVPLEKELTNLEDG